MPLSIWIVAVKDRAGISAATYDSEINRLITRLTPVIEHALLPEALASPDPGLQATLNEAGAEIVAGEFLSQHYRRPELLLSVIIGDLQLFPRRFDDPRDPSGLIASGWARLKPWLKVSLAAGLPTPVRAAGGKAGGKTGGEA